MIPDGILKKHISLAVDEIEKNGVPISRKSVHYDYVHFGKRYPPKYVISIAAKYAFGEELQPTEFNAVRARDYLRARAYTVIDRREEAFELIQNEDDESTFEEGAERYKKHRYRERDSQITKKAKANRLSEQTKQPPAASRWV